MVRRVRDGNFHGRSQEGICGRVPDGGPRRTLRGHQSASIRPGRGTAQGFADPEERAEDKLTAPATNKPQNGAAVKGGDGAAALPAAPFLVGTYDTTTPDLDVTLAQTTSAQKL